MDEIERLKLKVEQDPSSTLFVPLAEMYRKAGRTDEAISVLKGGIERQPGYVSARVALGKLYCERKLFADAKAELEQVLAAVPDNLFANKKLAEIYRTLGDAQRAAARYRRVLKLTPDDTEAEAALKALASLPQKGKTASGDMGFTLDATQRLNPEDIKFDDEAFAAIFKESGEEDVVVVGSEDDDEEADRGEAVHTGPAISDAEVSNILGDMGLSGGEVTDVAEVEIEEDDSSMAEETISIEGLSSASLNLSLAEQNAALEGPVHEDAAEEGAEEFDETVTTEGVSDQGLGGLGLSLAEKAVASFSAPLDEEGLGEPMSMSAILDQAESAELEEAAPEPESEEAAAEPVPEPIAFVPEEEEPAPPVKKKPDPAEAFSLSLAERAVSEEEEVGGVLLGGAEAEDEQEVSFEEAVTKAPRDTRSIEELARGFSLSLVEKSVIESVEEAEEAEAPAEPVEQAAQKEEAAGSDETVVPHEPPADVVGPAAVAGYMAAPQAEESEDELRAKALAAEMEIFDAVESAEPAASDEAAMALGMAAELEIFSAPEEVVEAVEAPASLAPELEVFEAQESAHVEVASAPELEVFAHDVTIAEQSPSAAELEVFAAEEPAGLSPVPAPELEVFSGGEVAAEPASMEDLSQGFASELEIFTGEGEGEAAVIAGEAMPEVEVAAVEITPAAEAEDELGVEAFGIALESEAEAAIEAEVVEADVVEDEVLGAEVVEAEILEAETLLDEGQKAYEAVEEGVAEAEFVEGYGEVAAVAEEAYAEVEGEVPWPGEETIIEEAIMEEALVDGYGGISVGSPETASSEEEGVDVASKLREADRLLAQGEFVSVSEIYGRILGVDPEHRETLQRAQELKALLRMMGLDREPVDVRLLNFLKAIQARKNEFQRHT